MKKKKISVIVTCYNEEENILEMYTRIKRVFSKLPTYGFEILFVDNASTDKSDHVFDALAKKDKKVKVIYMSRNFGSPQPSFLAGLSYMTGDAAVLLHGDIQDPPELIEQFVKHWAKGFDVVYGIRTFRKGYGAFMNIIYKGFYYLFDKLSYIKTPLNAGEFSLIDRKVIDNLLRIQEFDYHVRFLRAYVGFSQKGIEYKRDARHHGKTTETFITGLVWAKTFIINFSFKPLSWISTLAFFVTIATIVLFIVNFILILIKPGPPGIPTIVLLILFLGAVQLLSLSVIAEYLAKIFLEVKARPRYIVKKTRNIRRKPGNRKLT